MADKQIRAGIVARVSKKKTDGQSVPEQEDLCRAACAANGWEVAAVYGHTGSASRFAKAGNPAWDRLQRDLGSLGVVVLWEPSRGSRDLTTWSQFLDRARKRKLLIHVVTHHRTYDMSVPRDWRSLAEDGVDSAYESEKTSERISRAMRNAIGPCAYGYRREYDPKTGKFVRQWIHEPEAAIVRRIFRDVAGRVPLNEITRSLQNEGVPVPGKAPCWYRVTVRRIASNPAYTGKRKDGDGFRDVPWPPVVSDAEFHAARRVIDGIRDEHWQHDIRPGEVRYLLSRIAVCAVCDTPLAAHGRGYETDETGDRIRLADYRCPSPGGHVSIREETLNGIVEPLALEQLAKPEVWARFAPPADDEVAEAKEAVAKLIDRRNEIDGLIRSGEMPAADGARLLHGLAGDIKRAQRAADDMSADSAKGIWPNADRWYLQPLQFKRHVIRQLFERIEVWPRGTENRVRITPATRV